MSIFALHHTQYGFSSTLDVFPPHRDYNTQISNKTNNNPIKHQQIVKYNNKTHKMCPTSTTLEHQRETLSHYCRFPPYHTPTARVFPPRWEFFRHTRSTTHTKQIITWPGTSKWRNITTKDLEYVQYPIHLHTNPTDCPTSSIFHTQHGFSATLDVFLQHPGCNTWITNLTIISKWRI